MILKFLASLFVAIAAFCAPAYATCIGTGTCALLDNGTVGNVAAAASAQSVSVKTTTYSIVSSDVGSVLSLTGASFYTVTFGTPGSFTSGAYTLQNNDTRGKLIALSGGITYTLWPGQTDTITNVSGSWVAQKGPQRYVVANPVCYVDNVSGKALGATDGLVSGAGAFSSFQGCYQNALKNFDANGTPFSVNLTASQTYATANDFNFNGIVPGSYGMVINGNGAAIAVTSGSTQAAVNYVGVSGQVSIGNVTIGCSASNCADVSISYPGELNVYSPVTFYGSTGPHLQASGSGSILYVTGTNFSNSPTANVIAGGGTQHLQAIQGGFLIDYSTSNTLSASVAFTMFAYAGANGVLQGPGGSSYPITLGAYSVTGIRYYAQTGANITNTGGCGSTYFPGNSAGSSTGGYCN